MNRKLTSCFQDKAIQKMEFGMTWDGGPTEECQERNAEEMKSIERAILPHCLFASLLSKANFSLIALIPDSSYSLSKYVLNLPLGLQS